MSYRHTIRFFLLSIFLCHSPAFAENLYETRAFPAAHELFATLQADPTDPRFTFQFGAPVSQRAIANIDVGDYLGVYRWALGGGRGAAQLNLGGAILTRFDGTPSHSLQVIDFYGNVPLDIRFGSFSARFMFYHDSSHLGDDYLREKNIQSIDHSWEALRAIFSYEPWKMLRLYGGYTDAIHTKPAWDGRYASQGGFEIYLNPEDNSFWHPYWANDIQAWQRSGNNVTWSSQVGLKTGSRSSKGRGISYFVEFISGPRYEGQFFSQRETYWGAGLKFHLTQTASINNSEDF
jgi:hypothetical protein